MSILCRFNFSPAAAQMPASNFGPVAKDAAVLAFLSHPSAVSGDGCGRVKVASPVIALSVTFWLDSLSYYVVGWCCLFWQKAIWPRGYGDSFPPCVS